MPPQETDYLTCDDDALLADCDVHIYKSSGPGGQHRNKVSSAVRLRHRPTGISSHGDESRSQHDNKRAALRRMRMNIACQLRRPVAADSPLPPVVADCISGSPDIHARTERRLFVGAKDHRFWQVASYLLDVLESHEGRPSESAAFVGITTGNFARMLRNERHVFGAAQMIRKRHGKSPLT